MCALRFAAQAGMAGNAHQGLNGSGLQFVVGSTATPRRTSRSTAVFGVSSHSVQQSHNNPPFSAHSAGLLNAIRISSSSKVRSGQNPSLLRFVAQPPI